MKEWGQVQTMFFKNKISVIYEHPNEIYSVYLKETGEAVWIDGKIDLYRFLSSLSGKL